MRGYRALARLALGAACGVCVAAAVVLLAAVSRQGEVRAGLQRLTAAGNATAGARWCDAAIVYNKPHKTGSTTIQQGLLAWARASGRRAVACSPYVARNSMALRECIPVAERRCAVVASHLELDDGTRRLLRRRLGGDFVSVTSTRAPEARLVSLYLQTRQISAREAGARMPDMAAFLRRHNPWELYNYHTGGARAGACPLDEPGRQAVVNLVKHYDVVLDVDEREVSRAILRDWGLFELSRKRLNRRGGDELVLSARVKQALRNVTCVEEEMHRLFRLRMASLYGKATNKPCLSSERHPKPCF